MTPLEEMIGHAFRRPELLEEALTHPSLGKARGQAIFNNQRLEFLGDSVLGMVVAEMLFAMYPAEQEGALAKRHAALVCSDTLVAIARALELGQHMKLSGSEQASGGRDNPSALEDQVEALIGALYLDGGLEVAAAFIRKHWYGLAESTAAPPKDAKSALQEWAQARGLPLPSYTVVENTGPAHAPQFTVEVSVQGHPPARATAASKRAAEQLAAGALVERLG